MPLLKMNQLGDICSEGFNQERQFGDIWGTVTGAVSGAVKSLTGAVTKAPETIVKTTTQVIPSTISKLASGEMPSTTVLEIGALVNPYTTGFVINSELIKLATGGKVDTFQMAVDTGEKLAQEIIVPKKSDSEQTGAQATTVQSSSGAPVASVPATGTTLTAAQLAALKAKTVDTRHPMAVNRLA